MDNKPKFGVNSASDDPKPTNDETDTTTEKVTTETETETQQPQFGTQAAVDQPKDLQHYGHYVTRFFKLQPASFWITQYIFSFIGLLLFSGGFSASAMSQWGWWFILDFILYPVTVTVFKEIGGLFHKEPGAVARLLFATPNNNSDESNGSMVMIYWFFRFIFFMVKWLGSIIIGPVGLIYMNHEAKKMNL
ncbi:hypothetical protein [Levilactobacillus wangkuiensis]|uniref:hypothetical protein n=1 Tax=Levilactobacillus wangkuiensis TaxID=2799566 RepID=UPI0019455773|nr:hypothetical protein [Levilactobacillus wangkuiensis]